MTGRTDTPSALTAADERFLTELEWDMGAYRRRAEAFGCTAVVIDGHDRLRALAAGKPVTLLTATRDLDLSQAAVLAGLLCEAK